MSIGNEPFTTARSEAGYTVTAAVPGRYSLYASASPDGFTSDAWLCDFTHTAAVADPMPGRRCWLHVLDDRANHRVTASRLLNFATVENFRDLGGYLAKDGRAVRWGRFYRSAGLSHLDDGEVASLRRLGVRTILDLRSSGEVRRRPDPVLDGCCQKNLSAILQMDGNEKDFDPANLLTQSVEQMKQDEADFMEIYRAMPFGNRAYQWMFDRLCAGSAVPLLFHCTAGKDRTGIAAALILLALGVERDTIEQDYMLTNVCCKKNIEALITGYYTPGQPEFVKGYLTCIGGVGQHNLDAALDAIWEKYSSPERFLECEYGLTAEKLCKLRADYLEAPHA